MKLSILLVTYNQRPYIEECLSGILAQSVPFPVELVVADDCSTDGTLSCIERAVKPSELVYKILESPANLGMRKNYQRGLTSCAGEYIAILEGDDCWIDSNRLVKHVSYLDAHPECAMTFNTYWIFDHKKHTGNMESFVAKKKSLQNTGVAPQKKYELITTGMLAEQNHIGNLSACVIRRTAFQKLPEAIHELGFADWMLGMALGEHGTVVKIRDRMSVYRVHEGGLWSGKKNREEKLLYRIDDYDEFLGFRYHEHFERHKRRLKHQIKVRHLQGLMPMTLFLLLRRLVPARMRGFIVRMVPKRATKP